MSRSRTWCFTINNPVFEEEKTVVAWDAAFIVFQLEEGENGTRHFQGVLKMRSMKSLAQMKRLHATAHWEVTRDLKASIKYCQKEDTRVDGPWQAGDVPAQGKRTDILAIKRKLDEGATIKEIADDDFGAFLRYERGFRSYKRMCTKERDHAMTVEVYWGPPGTGKSRKVRAENPGAYWKQRGEWWDGYEGQKVVVLDDFYGWIRWSTLLRVCDRYPLLVETKGGQAQFVAEKIIITSNNPWREWYTPEGKDLAALERRITKVVHFNEPL